MNAVRMENLWPWAASRSHVQGVDLLILGPGPRLVRSLGIQRVLSEPYSYKGKLKTGMETPSMSSVAAI